jgi:hypothetical protein
MNRELHATVTEIESTLQDARGELSVFEDKFPTDSPEAQLIAELLERLDEASDPRWIEENVRYYADDYGVDEEEVFAPDVREGDIVLDFGVVEVIGIDSWWHPHPNGVDGYDEYELTVQPYGKEAFTTVHNSGAKFRVALRES